MKCIRLQTKVKESNPQREQEEHGEQEQEPPAKHKHKHKQTKKAQAARECKMAQFSKRWSGAARFVTGDLANHQPQQQTKIAGPSRTKKEEGRGGETPSNCVPLFLQPTNKPTNQPN